MIQGTRDQVREHEPLPPVTDLPQPPAFLHPYAVEYWHSLSADLWSMGVLTDVDVGMFCALCMAWARWRIAEDVVAAMAEKDTVTHGLMMQTKGGNAIQNPVVGTANHARASFARLALEFGLSPSARTQISAKGKGESDPVARKYFGA
jgi:P27 family predicted phage terminase small subunit